MSSLHLIGLSHRRAPVELRERVALTEAEAAELSRRLAGADAEAVCLSTCNRTEIYCAGGDAAEALALLSERSGLSADELADVAYRLRDDDVALHLYRVAAGLDSLVPGEGQILGQVRSAFDHGAPGRCSTGCSAERFTRAEGAARDGDRRSARLGGCGRSGARRAALRRSRELLGDAARRGKDGRAGRREPRRPRCSHRARRQPFSGEGAARWRSGTAASRSLWPTPRTGFPRPTSSSPRRARGASC